NSSGRRRVDANSSGAKSSVEQNLHDESAERMTHQNWRIRELGDDPHVMVYYGRELQAFEWRRITPQCLNLAFEPRPRWRHDGEARLLVPIDPVFPASRSEPKPVNQNYGRLVGATSVSAHDILRWMDAANLIKNYFFGGGAFGGGGKAFTRA